MPRALENPSDLGQYMTPMTVAGRMAARPRRPPAQWHVLDPACGDGNLLLSAAETMRAHGAANIEQRLWGLDIDAKMVAAARRRLADFIGCPPAAVNIFEADFLESAGPLFDRGSLDLAKVNILISNPPYGHAREYKFFEKCAKALAPGTECVFLMPLAFIDRVAGPAYEALKGRPLGVTTGHAIAYHRAGAPYRTADLKKSGAHARDFTVHSGIKIYEKGAGIPPQTQEIMAAKPYSSASRAPGWLPCLRTGDIKPFAMQTGRLWVDYGAHIAHPKTRAQFSGPKVFLRRVPIWKGRQLGAVFDAGLTLCAGDVLVVRHKADDEALLKGLCVYLNSREAAAFLIAQRPSLGARDSYPKFSAIDINRLISRMLPPDDALRRRAQDYPAGHC